MPLLHVALTTATLCLLESTASLLTTVCCCLPRLSLVLSDAEAAALAASSPAHLLQAGDNYMYIPGVIGTTTASPLHSCFEVSGAISQRRVKLVAATG